MIIIIHYSLLFIKIELYCQNCYCNTLTDILVLILKVNCIGRLWNDITNSIPFIFFLCRMSSYSRRRSVVTSIREEVGPQISCFTRQED